MNEILCEGCGREYLPEKMSVLPTKVNLRDGTSRDVLFCGNVCADFWDETGPGEWTQLHDGTEVQQVLWRCVGCDGVYDQGMVKLLIDTDYVPERVFTVCSFCQKKDSDRFQEKEIVS